MKFAKAFAAAAALLSTGVSALPKVTRAGRYLYQEDGTRFYVKVGFAQHFSPRRPSAIRVSRCLETPLPASRLLVSFLTLFFYA